MTTEPKNPNPPDTEDTAPKDASPPAQWQAWLLRARDCAVRWTKWTSDRVVPWTKWFLTEAWEVISATASQTKRLVQYGVSVGRNCILRRGVRKAQLALGEQMYRETVGDDTIRADIGKLDEQIAEARAAKRSPTAILRQRRRQLEALAELSLTNHEAQTAGNVQDYEKFCELRRNVEHAEQVARTQKAAMFPHDALGRRRIAIGFGAALLAVFGFFAFSTGRQAGDGRDVAPTDVLTSQQADSVAKAAKTESIHYYTQTQGILNQASECAADQKAIDGHDDSKQFRELQQRAYLISDIAMSQASIWDLNGTETSLNRLRQLGSIKLAGTQCHFDLSNAIIAVAVAHANQGDVTGAERVLIQLNAKDVNPIQGIERTTARGLAQIAWAFAATGDMTQAKLFMQKLQELTSRCTSPDDTAFMLGELGKTYAKVGRLTDSAGVTERLVDLRSNAKDGSEKLLLAINEALGGIALAEVEAGSLDGAETTIGFIEDSDFVLNGTWFAVGQAMVNGADFGNAKKAVTRITDDWLQARLIYAITAAEAKFDEAYADDVLKLLDVAAKKTHPFFNTPLWNQLFYDMNVAIAGCEQYKLVLDHREKLKPEHDACIMAIAGLSAVRHKDPKTANELFAESLVGADGLELLEQREVYKQIGECLAEAGKVDEAMKWSERESSSFRKGALLLGAAIGVRARESLSHAAHEGVLLPGRAQPTRINACDQSMWRKFLVLGEGRQEGKLVDYSLLDGTSSSGYELLIVPSGLGIDFAFPPRSSGIRGFCVHLGVGEFFTHYEKEELAGFLEKPIGVREQVGRFYVQKRAAVRPAEWIVVSVEAREPGDDAPVTGATGGQPAAPGAVRTEDGQSASDVKEASTQPGLTPPAGQSQPVAARPANAPPKSHPIQPRAAEQVALEEIPDAESRRRIDEITFTVQGAQAMSLFSDMQRATDSINADLEAGRPLSYAPGRAEKPASNEGPGSVAALSATLEGTDTDAARVAASAVSSF